MLKKYKIQKACLLIVFQVLFLNSYSDAFSPKSIRDNRELSSGLENNKAILQDTIPDEKFVPVEVFPEYSGGMENLYKFISKKLNYPEEAKKKNIQGRVIVSFVVEKDGSLTNMKVIRGIGHGCDEEALRVMSLSPKWKPGMQNGRPVRVSYSLPVCLKIK